MRSIARHGVRLLVATATMAALPALIAVTPAHATDECNGYSTSDNSESGEYGDCVHMEVYTAVDESIVVVYWGNQDYDFYQLRWSRPGRAETQRVVRGEGASGSWWALNNAWSDTPYTFKVQACYSDLFGSDCTAWAEVTYVKDDQSVWE
jgi:hypothetical protein